MANVVNGKTELASLIPTIWAPQLYARLKQNLVFMNLFERTYQGSIASVGDTVKVNQIGEIVGETLTDDKQAFTSQSMPVNTFSIVANRRAVAAVEITDMAQLQSIAFQGDLMDELTFQVMQEIESYLISLLVPSSSAPDHQIAPASASDLASVDITSLRTLASQAYWPLANRHVVLDPAYYSDLSNKAAVVSFDYTRTNDSGEASVKKFAGFSIQESNMLGADIGYALHPSAIQAVMQPSIQVKVSDLHGQNKFGSVISADIIYGATLFDNKRIIKISG